jgi:uracil-DNA glycosylase
VPYISNRGDKNSRIWIILERPYSSDEPKGFVFSGGMASVFGKMLTEAGLNLNECYVCARRPNTDEPHAFQIIENELNHYKPPLILALNESGACYLPELCAKGDSDAYKGQLQKNAGSLLSSSLLHYPHYMMPVYGPDRCVADWTERNVTTYVDLQKLRDEFEFWKKHGSLRPLPERKLVYGDLTLSEVLSSLERFKTFKLLSVDIETVYPREKSAFHPHPGYPVTIGIAGSADYGISFNLFRNSPRENRILWRSLDKLLRGKAILGQNFFNFDALFFESLGFTISLDKVQDTLLRHHILWPELSHKLSFMTRQYTREPYYKDDGHGWTVKHMDKLRRYNCLDVCVTMEIYEKQEEEFKQLPYLRSGG